VGEVAGGELGGDLAARVHDRWQRLTGHHHHDVNAAAQGLSRAASREGSPRVLVLEVAAAAAKAGAR
jgi:hypothetical protein